MKTLFLFLSVLCAAAWGLTPQQVVVVYNADSPLSKESAEMYAAVRRVPQENLVPLSGLKPGAQDMSRKDYDAKVVEPLMKAALANDWQWPTGVPKGMKRMAAMVLMPDLPLRIKEQVQRPIPKNPDGTPDFRVRPPEDAAALDSELALLGASYPLTSAVNNPFYKKDAAIDKAHPPVLAVCRIDGPDKATIHRMIQDPVTAERRGLWGWTVVDEGGPYPQGDAMFKAVADAARQNGQPLFYETSKATLAPAFPMMPHTAVYFGWYTNKANGPFAPTAPKDFSFEPGAVACHLYSFSCTNIKSRTQWAPALLARGACVTTGNVAEPLLAGCLDFAVFYDRLLKGYTVAEAGLMAMPMLSWQAIVIGDPLYRPYAVLKAGRGDTKNPFVAWSRMLKAAKGNTVLVENAVKQQLSGSGAAFYAEMYAWECANSGNLYAAADYFRMAGAAAAAPQDKLRNKLMQITTLFVAGDKSTAAALMHQCLEETEGTPHFPAVEKTAATVLKREGWKPKPKQPAR